MDDYISRKDAQDETCDRCNQQGHCNRPELCPVMISIKSIPAADVRPVVLCRDCKHGQGEKMDFWNEYEGIECVGGVVHRKDWFCADGEKREN